MTNQITKDSYIFQFKEIEDINKCTFDEINLIDTVSMHRDVNFPWIVTLTYDKWIGADSCLESFFDGIDKEIHIVVPLKYKEVVERKIKEQEYVVKVSYLAN
jgi:hypothetical protein